VRFLRGLRSKLVNIIDLGVSEETVVIGFKSGDKLILLI